MDLGRITSRAESSNGSSPCDSELGDVRPVYVLAALFPAHEILALFEGSQSVLRRMEKAPTNASDRFWSDIPNKMNPDENITGELFVAT